MNKTKTNPRDVKPSYTVLVVDDEKDFREDVKDALSAGGFQVLEAPSADEALNQAQRHTVDAALLDLVMPGMSGVELMRELHHIDSMTAVILLTGQGSVESAVDAMQGGALDYLSKPVKLDELEIMVRRACEHGRLARQNRAYRSVQTRGQRGETTTVIAKSEAMRELVRKAEALAAMNMPVLILGESGTGKEIAARLIYANSDRADMPLTVLNCAAIPDNLIDAELFGHEKGTYTGATEARPGMIEIADAGTLLLDEIGDMPVQAQTRLLRFLENGTIRRVGGRMEKAVDVRVLATTNRDLAEAIETGDFREDLYHRLKGFELVIPPLRERPDDILPFAESVLERGSSLRHPSLPLEPSARQALCAYPWPGNMRELMHTVKRAVFMAVMDGADAIRTEHLNLPLDREQPMDLESVMAEAQRLHVHKVLSLTNGNRRKAAEILGVSERQMYRLIGDAEPDAS